MTEYNEYTDNIIKQVRKNTEEEARNHFKYIQYYTNIIEAITCGEDIRDEFMNYQDYIGALKRESEELLHTVASGNTRIKTAIEDYERYEKAKAEAEAKKEEYKDKYEYDNFEDIAEQICNLFQDDVMFETTDTYIDEVALELMEIKNKLEQENHYQCMTVVNLGSISVRFRGVYTPANGIYLYVSRVSSRDMNEFKFRI